MSNSVDKKNGIILILTDGGFPEFYRILFLKNKKVAIHNFQDASEILKHCRIDIVLLHCTNDFEAGLNILRNNKAKYPHIPNIFITDINYEGLVLKVFRSGARDFFRKPINNFELKDSVKGLLNVKQSSRESRRPFLNISQSI